MNTFYRTTITMLNNEYLKIPDDKEKIIILVVGVNILYRESPTCCAYTFKTTGAIKLDKSTFFIYLKR